MITIKIQNGINPNSLVYYVDEDTYYEYGENKGVVVNKPGVNTQTIIYRGFSQDEIRDFGI